MLHPARGTRTEDSAVVPLVAIRRSSYLRIVVHFSRRDVRAALELVQAASSAEGAEPFPEPAIESLARLVPADMVGYNERELADYRLLAMAETPLVTRPPEVIDAVTTFCGDYPLSNLRRSSERRALKISDFASPLQLHRLDYYNHALRPLGIEYQMRLWLAAPAGIARFFYLNRERAAGDFEERDRGLLELVRPFLVAIRERLELRLGRRGRGAELGLTDRELEILDWVARGKTNREIAALLVVSPHTVRKHLEHAYEKLGVHTRTAAVARAFLDPAAPDS
jgi:DNA-binding CsgD family transcriptional regulator